MMIARKNGREIVAMVMNEPVNGVHGIVQCTTDGCQAYMPLTDDNGPVSEAIDWFLTNHDCNPNRHHGSPKDRKAVATSGTPVVRNFLDKLWKKRPQ